MDDEEVISRAAAVAQEFFLAGDVEGKLRVLRGGEGVQREASEYFRARGVAVITTSSPLREICKSTSARAAAISAPASAPSWPLTRALPATIICGV